VRVDVLARIVRPRALCGAPPAAGVFFFFFSALLYICVSFIWPIALGVSMLLVGFGVRIAHNCRRIYGKFQLGKEHMIDGRVVDQTEYDERHLHGLPPAQRRAAADARGMISSTQSYARPGGTREPPRSAVNI
jgi:hypothetical protein